MKMNELPSQARHVLWICREMPYPLTSGDRVYSAGIARALADAGLDITFLAHEGPNQRRGERHDAIQWRGIAGGTRSDKWVALSSPLPVTAGIHKTRTALHELSTHLADPTVDVIVFDQLGAGWALQAVQQMQAQRRAAGEAVPTLVYLAHNHEKAVWAGMARQATGSLARRVAVRRNAHKVAVLEQRLVRAVDLVSTITEEDGQAFLQDGARRAPVIITPGYSGAHAPERTIARHTPRRVAMVGSFKWAIKEENLRQFLQVADPAFAEAGIHFDVVGSVPQHLRDDLEGKLQATTLHGFVDDPAAIFAASRLAVVPELIGGGFKLKLLDYLFSRMPVATIAAAAAGLPADLRAQMLQADDLAGLVKVIIERIDDTAALDAMQRRSYELALAAYRWAPRGVALREAIEAARNAVQPVEGPSSR